MSDTIYQLISKLEQEIDYSAAILIIKHIISITDEETLEFVLSNKIIQNSIFIPPQEPVSELLNKMEEVGWNNLLALLNSNMDGVAESASLLLSKTKNPSVIQSLLSWIFLPIHAEIMLFCSRWIDDPGFANLKNAELFESYELTFYRLLKIINRCGEDFARQNPETLSILIDYCYNEDPGIRLISTIMLACFPNKDEHIFPSNYNEALISLISLINDPEPEVRYTSSSHLYLFSSIVPISELHILENRLKSENTEWVKNCLEKTYSAIHMSLSH